MRRRAVAAAIAVVALASLPHIMAGASSTLKPPPLAAGSYRHLPAADIVKVRDLAAPVARTRAGLSRASLVKNHAAPAWTTTASPTLPRYAWEGDSARPAATPVPAPGTVQEQLTVFPGIDITQGVTTFGQDNNMEPPDTQIAVGPDVVVEMVNANMSVWSKAGMRLAITDLNVFYSVPAGSTLTDPRVLYDQGSGRFIASAVAIDTTINTPHTWDSNVYLAVSQSSDPTGAWTKQTLKTTSAVLMDQPKVGNSDDKIAVAWSEWLRPGCDPTQPNFACFVGDVYSVVDKGDMLGGSPTLEYVTGRDIFRYAIIPVQALSSTTTQYLAYNNADPFNLVENACVQPNPPLQYGPCPTIGIISISGSVHASTLFIREVDRPISSTTSLPKAVQQGSAAQLDTGDDRLLSAVWQNNQLWTSSGDGNFCPMANPNGPGQRSCALIIEVQTDTNPMTVQMDKTIDSSDFVYHPAISLDNAGDLFVVFSRSSSTTYPSVWVNGWLAATNTWTPITLLAAGTGFYDSMMLCGGTNRWGDYSGAAVDGSDPTDVWAAGEYAALDTTRNCTWKTAIGRLTYSAPTVTSVKPATGPGGTSVMITGTDFMSGATTVYFGSTPAASGTTTVQSPNRITVTAPPGNGLVYLSASTTDGHGPLGAVYKYPRLETAPGSIGSIPGGVLRGGAPPPVPPKPAGTRPLIPSFLLEAGASARQPVRLFRLLLL